ncbi:MAG TPA: MFS transporter [Alphaproteobacteria bacterium]|nr:MFS transporter [Alphaproteobacteria bacterium]
MSEAASISGTFCPVNRRRHVLIAAILASAMGFIDGSVLAIATPAIRADLGASLGDAQWISNGYMLFLSSLLLIGGALGDRFGLRNVFAAGIGLFVAASIGSALAPNPPLLIAARALQGLGAAVMVPGSLAIIAKAYPRAERGKAIGIWASASSLTTILGPILGGLVLTWLGDWSWRLVFAINLPLGGGALALLFGVPADRSEGGRRLDLVGGALVTAALFLIAFGLTDTGGGAPPPGHIALYGGIGLVLLAGFLVWEARAKVPMLPLGLFGNLGFAGAQALTFALYFALSGVLFFLPMTLIAGWGTTAAEVSFALLPFGVVLTILSPISGRLADRIGAGPMIAAGATLVGIAFALMGVTSPLENVWLVLLPINVLLGIGMGLVVSPLSTAVMTSVADSDTGLASGVNNAVARVAGLFAIALLGGVVAMVFQGVLGHAAAGQPLAFGLPPQGDLPPEMDAVRRAATDAAFATVCYINAALAFCSAVIAWFTQERKLRGAITRPTPP